MPVESADHQSSQSLFLSTDPCSHGRITGARDDVTLPPECACLEWSVSGHAIFTAADDLDLEQRHTALFSRLLHIGPHKDGHQLHLHQHLHSYSGATRRWSAHTEIRHGNRLRVVGARAAVVHRGAAHWLYTDDTIDVSVPQDQRHLFLLSAKAATGRATVTKLPIRAAGGLPFVCVSRDGRLSVARVHAMHVEVWTQQDVDDGNIDPVAWLRAQMFGKEWRLAQVIQMPAAAPAGENFMSCGWFYFNKGAMLAVYSGNGAFVLDLETKSMEKIMDLSECASSYGYYSSLPYEMDLPEFFLGQLGGRATETEKQVGVALALVRAG